MKRCDGSPTLKNMSRLFCATLVDTATLQQNETICPLTPGNLTMESFSKFLHVIFGRNLEQFGYLC